MATGMDMLVGALLKATGFSLDDMKREAAQAYEMLKRFAGEQTRATQGIDRIEAATMRIESRLGGSPDLPSEFSYPPEAFAVNGEGQLLRGSIDGP